METKSFLRSKTLWVNLLALIGSLAVSYGMSPANWAEISTTSLAVVNIVLRCVTKQGLDSGLSSGTNEGQ